jgi:glutathione-regulated potassium-efflux system ancillary protein KefC/glutathione-regulated potassium-efflux system protein KefB
MALGAFLAGVLLADSEFRHELEADIEPFKGLLLGLFFMAVGMSANLSLITSSPGTVLGIAGGLVLVKFVAMWVIARLAGAPGEVSERLAVSLAQGGEFAFVLLTGAASLAIFEPASAELLILAVTVSMLSAPILMLLHDRWMDRRLAAAPARPFDRIEEGANPVIIAGFGRFGQIVARVLRLCDVRFTALDVSSQQVDFVRQFGNLIYYGDASRHELLEAAKTGEAKLFVLAIDDVEASVRTARLVRRHYPKLPVVARARNRVHWYRLRDLGVTTIYRETFSSSLEAAHQALLRVGVGIAAAERAIALFRRHDEEQLLVQYAVHQDEAQLIQTAREAGEQLKELFDADAVGPASLSRREEAKPG